MNSNMMKVAVVAWRLSVSEAFVYQLIAEGRLKHHRLGKGQGGIRVSEEQLQEYLVGTRKGGEPVERTEPPAPPVKLRHLRVPPS
jgi:excisionase family DNA binding protein